MLKLAQISAGEWDARRGGICSVQARGSGTETNTAGMLKLGHARRVPDRGLSLDGIEWPHADSGIVTCRQRQSVMQGHAANVFCMLRVGSDAVRGITSLTDLPKLRLCSKPAVLA